MSPNNITTRILLEFCEPLEMPVVLAAICYITLFTLTKLPFDAPNFVGVWAIVPLDYQIKTSRGLFVLLPAMAEGPRGAIAPGEKLVVGAAAARTVDVGRG